MLIKHEIFKDVHSIEMATVSDALEEVLTIVDDVKTIRDQLLAFQEGDVDEFELVDEIAPYAVFNRNELSMFSISAASVNSIVNKYLKKVLFGLTSFSDNLNNATDCVFQIEDEELETLIKQAYNVIAGLVFFVVVEFNLFSMTGDVGTDYDVDEVFDGYCNKNGFDTKEKAIEILELSKEYRLGIDLFDSCPELEDPFYKVMGPFAAGVDFSIITLDDVRSVVNGEVSPEELVARFQINEEGDEE